MPSPSGPPSSSSIAWGTCGWPPSTTSTFPPRARVVEMSSCSPSGDFQYSWPQCGVNTTMSAPSAFACLASWSILPASRAWRESAYCAGSV